MTPALRHQRPEHSLARLPWDPQERTITPGDAEWPPGLSELGPLQPVDQLFATGRVMDAAPPAVAIVGTRRPTEAGIEVAEHLASELAAAGLVVVSGLAVGIDAVAHRAALDAGGSTVAVVGAGLDIDYPARNRSLRSAIERGGTVVSEHPRGVPPAARNFPARNRIIVGLVAAVIVVEGAVSSGAMITARQALDANRDVFAVPGSVRNAMAEGPNELLRRSQAGVVTEAAHVIDEIAPDLAVSRRPQEIPTRVSSSVSAEELETLSLLDDWPVAVDRLAQRLGTPLAELVGRLARLEVRGLITRGGAGYAITATGARARKEDQHSKT